MDKKQCNSCGEASHKCSCKNKDFTKAVIEIDNPEQITLMRKVVIPASMGDDTTVPPTVGKYHNVLLYYEANSKSYLYSSDGIPTMLVNGVTDYEAAVNLPQINGHTLLGNKTGDQLGLQNKLTAGENISIDSDNVISAVDTTYGPATDTEIGLVKPGAGLEVDANGTMSISDIEQYAHFFDTVADMKAADLADGDYARTLGYYSKNDMGGAYYKISSTAPSGYYEALTIGLYAELIIGPNVNVNQFGAKGDGSTDDTQAISEAINRVNTIDFLNLTYIINGLETEHDITIHGNGATLKWESDSNGVIEINHNVKIDNINFDKNNASNYVLYKPEDTDDNLVDVELSECSFSNSASGVVPLYLVHLNKLDINECTFSNLLSSSMNAGFIKFVNITNNLFDNIGNTATTNRSGSAIYIGHSQYISILNNTIVNCTDSAIYCSNSYAEFINISNNKINNSQKEGIKNQGAGRKTIIEGNILKDIYSNAIIVSSRQEECIVSNNIVEGSCIDGGVTSSSKVGAIAISYANRNVIVNNNIIKMTSLPDVAGVYIYNATGIDHVNIIGNLIDGTSGPAISATSCEFINVSSNICMNNCIKSTIAKIPVNLGSCTGTFNNNSISQPDILSISCIKIDDNNIRIPLGVCDCFSQSQNVTVYYVDGSGNKVSQLTTISAVDFANRTITLTDQLPSGNQVDEYYLEIDVSSIHLVNPMRLTGTSHIVAIGNHIRSIYGYNPNISTNSVMLPALTDFYTLNIRETS